MQYIQWRFQDGHDRELLEKATRVLTDEEKALLDQEWVGRDGSRRKLEVCALGSTVLSHLAHSPTDDHGSSKAQEDFPVRGQVEGT